MRRNLIHTYHDIISVENLLEAWCEFLKGKRSRKDVQEFEYGLMDNILALHEDLKNFTYTHDPYHHFKISDPKPRDIHKATVRDRLLHHAIYRVLYPFFDQTFVFDSYSCRIGRGTHRAINRFRKFGYQVSQNNFKTAWVLKCDIRKFFASIDHGVLLEILDRYIPDHHIVWLLKRIISSFETVPGKGLPLGNLTSQLLVNIYMNEFDQFVKHTLKARYYIRYADDFVILHENREHLARLISVISNFLGEKLKLTLHPDKLFLKTLNSGVDFLGWVHFSDHRVLRTTTKRRMLKRILANRTQEVLSSYRGLLRHGNSFKTSYPFFEYE